VPLGDATGFGEVTVELDEACRLVGMVGAEGWKIARRSVNWNGRTGGTWHA
jgi:hypothetical protein